MIIFLILLILLAWGIYKLSKKISYSKLEKEVFETLGIKDWAMFTKNDKVVVVKSKQGLENYDDIKYFKENEGELQKAKSFLDIREVQYKKISDFLKENEYQSRFTYKDLEKHLKDSIRYLCYYKVLVQQITSAGNYKANRTLYIDSKRVNQLMTDVSLLMSKGEYSKYLKEQAKTELEEKRHEFYGKVNAIIDFSNENKDKLVVSKKADEIDSLILKLYDRTVSNIQKIKTLDSEEWDMIGDFIAKTDVQIRKIVEENQKILDYYESDDFKKIKDTCANLMSSQREFNEYINEKATSISNLFGTRVVRSETVTEDTYNYIRPYKKSITPFTAEVSSSVFASAENNPLDYIVKYFYPNKQLYVDQIKKLQLLVSELETLREAKEIIENYKGEYAEYIEGVPSFILEQDETGFYSRLGFANIDESVLTIDYKFTYTSDGGMAQRSFGVPMTEETIVELIQLLESKLTMSAFTKEQRSMMTKKLREHIKERDNYTCCSCGNSTHVEPNLLLEIDHIVPVSKGGYTEENNLQTLCWKCNRSKSDKLM